MADQQTVSWNIRFISSITDIDCAAWNRLAGLDYPFVQHEFLLALESSGCTSPRSGWTPCHLLLEADFDNALLACLPLYIKTNSYGEYVFDWSWADAYARHGLSYYPKLLSAIPFTPCAGPRLLIAPDTDSEAALSVVCAALTSKVAELNASSWHLLFPDEAQKTLFSGQSLLLRTGCQYQWFNQDYRSFDDFLNTLNSRKRKNLRKERLRVAEQNISFKVLEGQEVTDTQWQMFFQFYQNTYVVRGRAPYLNLEFFLALARNLPQYLMLVLAYQDDECVAGALFFKGADTLYGRYWGSSEEFHFLHFETCYYQGIDYCIQHGCQRFDSGAQGEHKIQRGFKPVSTWSLHSIAHPEFARAIEHFIHEEEAHISKYINHATEFLPFRKDLQT